MENLLGPYAVDYYRDAFIFGMIGALLYKYFMYNPAKKDTSPPTFSLHYWLLNNWRDMAGGWLFFFTWIRFKNETLQAFPQNPLVVWLQVFTDSFFIHLMFGLLFTHIVKQIRKVLKKNRS